MKRKIKTGTLLLVSVLTLGMASPASGAELTEFTDASESSDAGIAAEEFGAGEFDEFGGGDEFAEIMPEEVFDAGESFVDDEAAAFLAEGEVPETVTLAGIEYEYVAETDTYRVVKGVDAEEVKLPYEIHGKKVSEIADGAFRGCKKIKDVSCEFGVEYLTIGVDAFRDCENLRWVRLPVLNGITVESNAFKNCPRLVTFDVDNMRQCLSESKFAEDAFDSDTKVVVFYWVGISTEAKELFDRLRIFHAATDEPFYEWVDEVEGMRICREYIDRDTKISYVANADESLEELKVYDDSPYEVIIGRKAFYGFENMKYVRLTEQVKAIETKAFYGCKNLEKVVIPASVTSIEQDAFAGSPKTVIYAPKDSYALTYAKENGIAYKVFGAEKMQRPVLTYEPYKYARNIITLKWNPIPFADGYQIYRYNSDKKTYERIKTIENEDKHHCEVTLRPGRTEYFKVRACSYAEPYSEKYGPSSKRVKAEGTPAMVNVRKVVAKYPNKLGVYWEHADGDGYLISRCEGEENYNNYKKVKYIKGSSITKFMDSGLKSGQTYYYRVRAYRYINGKRVWGPRGNTYYRKVVCK